jgi:purine-cytosine permease-like protein
MPVFTKHFFTCVLALLVVLGWFAVQGVLLSHLVAIVDPSMRDLLNRVLGTLDAALIMVLSYYFGSSRGSADKTDLLAAAGEK